jgi:hypothetical protein
VADEKLVIDITAKDDASKVIDPLAKKVANLENADATVDITADADKAENDVDTFAKKLNKLSDADQVVVLALRAGAAQSELSELALDLAKIDAADPNIDVKLAHYADVAAELDQLENKMKDIAATSPDPDVNDAVRNRLKGIGEEAGKTQGAVHSMAGNALGDFAATTSGIGPLGEAIGQLTEIAAEGETSMKGLATAGLGIGAVSGALIIVQLAMKSFADAAERAAKIKKFNTDDVEAFTKALKEGRDVTDDYVDRLREMGHISATVIPNIGTQWDNALKSIVDITPALRGANISAKEFAAGVTGTEQDFDRFVKAVQATNLSLEQQQLIISAATSEYNNLTTAQRNADQFHDVFGDQAKQVTLFNQATEDMRNKLTDADKAAFGLGTRIGKAADKTHDLEDAYRDLSDQISNDQAMIDLADQIDAVTEAGNTAITAQHEADEARRKGAKDATDQQHEAEQAMRDYQTAVNQTKQDIINLAEQAKVSPVELKATLDKVDAGDLAGAKADAEAWSKRNPVQLQAELDLTKILKSIPIIGGILKIQPGAATTTNNFIAAPDARRQAAAMARTARVNGR